LEILKNLIYIVLFLLSSASCGNGKTDCRDYADSTAVVEQICADARMAMDAEDADSAFSLLLGAEPYLNGCGNKAVKYSYYDQMARLYEQKNLFALQEKALGKKRAEITGPDSVFKMASTDYELGVSKFAQENFVGASRSLNDAILHSPPDSINFIAQCYVMLSQVYLQTQHADSVKIALENARRICPGIMQDPLFRLSEIYMLHGEGKSASAVQKVKSYLPSSGLYEKIELLNILAAIHEEQGKQQMAIDDLKQIIEYNDSAALIEASETTAKIHRLRHEEQIRLAKSEQESIRAVSRARIIALVCLLLAVIAVATALTLWLRRRALRARQAELEALRLAEDARAGEAEVKALNQELQKRYYDHLYAIILPILNAERTKTGYIDLKEKSWRLIETNTDLVLPHFTTKLRKNHPTLGDEDVRFCCLVAMQVPNPIIANVYGIAPSSVSVRKQRMKKKLDEGVINETLESYLYKYSL
jgi:cytochrome c-type biogenesis protein CcmH/NrfG